MSVDAIFQEALDPAHRPNPYPYLAALPRTPTRLADGRFLVAGYADVLAILHDARFSSQEPHPASQDPHPVPPEAGEPPARWSGRNILRLDPPEHDTLRRIMMRQFGPPNRPHFIADLESAIVAQVHELIDAFAQGEAEIVGSFAHRLPIAIICKLLGVPALDEDRFHEWVVAITNNTGAGERSKEATEAGLKLGRYLTEIAESHRGTPGDGMLSGLVNDDGPDGSLPKDSVGATAALLLIAGHETTVNLISNGILTLIRHPDEIGRLRGDPAYAALVVEELLRFEPPVQFIQSRHAIADAEVGGVAIPAGSRVALLVAAANRDPDRFPEPDRFDPSRSDNQHLGFGSGIHSCFGAPLARLESQIALRLFFERVREPRILADPPYRVSPLLRGPSELRIGFTGIAPRSPDR